MMTTRSQSQKMNSQSQRRLSTEKSKNIDINQLILDKIDAMSNKFTQQFVDFKKEIRHEIRSDLKEINQKVDVLLTEVQSIKKRVDILEYRNDNTELHLSKLENKRDKDMDELAILDQKLREKTVKIRGLAEEKNENVADRIIQKMAEFLGKNLQDMQSEIDTLFRVNSKIAKQKGLPRDVLINFVKRQTKDHFLTKHNQDSFCIDGQPVKVLKDIPSRILRKRRAYMPLTSLLKREKVQYRWDSPEGLTFLWNRKRIRISSSEQANNFVREHLGRRKRHQKDHAEGKDKANVDVQLNEEEPGASALSLHSQPDLRDDLSGLESDEDDVDEDDADPEEKNEDDDQGFAKNRRNLSGIENVRNGEEDKEREETVLNSNSPLGIEYFDD